MARSHARIYTSIWSDVDFIALQPEAQRMFLFLVSQPDLEHSGVIALRERRWSRASAGLTPDDVTKALAVLADARFVVYDEDTEELLVRSLMRWDGVWKQPNVAKSAATNIRTVASEALRHELYRELGRLDSAEVHQDVLGLQQELRGDLKEACGIDDADELESPSVTPTATPKRRGNGTPSRGDKGKGSTTCTTGDSPFPGPRPQPVPPPAAGKPAREGTPGTTLPDMPDDPAESPNQRANRLTQAFAELRPLSNFNAAAGIVRKAINAGHSDGVIEAGLRKVVTEGKSLTAESLRIAIEGAPKRDGSRGGAADDLTDQKYGPGSTDI